MMLRSALETTAAIVCAGLAIGAVAFTAKRGDDDARRRQAAVEALVHGSTSQGAVDIAAAGCGGCHKIPGIATAHGRVGPDLSQFGGKPFIAGVAPNTPGNLVLWIRSPQTLSP